MPRGQRRLIGNLKLTFLSNLFGFFHGEVNIFLLFVVNKSIGIVAIVPHRTPEKGETLIVNTKIEMVALVVGKTIRQFVERFESITITIDNDATGRSRR